MSQKFFLAVVITLSVLTIMTSPPVVRPLLEQEPTPTPTSLTPTPTSTSTSTPDPFANIPTATPRTNGFVIEVQSLPSPALGELPPTFTPTPAAASMSTSLTMLLPNPTTNETATGLFPAPPEGPAGMPPDRLRITRLALDVQVAPVGMVAGPWAGPGGFVSAAMPSGKMAGWLNTSAPFAQPGNTVLTGRHQAQDLTVFHGLWTLEPGDEIVLYAGDQSQRYVVDEVLILPEQDQPIEVRLANAEYIQPTEDERLTIVTGWPEKGNTHRTVVIALPEQ